MENVYDKFAHYEKPLNDFERARQQISTPFDYYDLDLSTANTNMILPISGDFLYIDQASTGYATIELNNQHDVKKAPFYVRKGFALGATFKQLKISNSAQPGAFIRIMFSTGDRVIPAIGDLNISGNVTTVADGFTYGSSYKDNALIGAAGYVTVITPAANANGVIVQDASLYSYMGAANPLVTLIAKASAPTNVLDGDVILSFAVTNGNQMPPSRVLRPVTIAAGKGLYIFNGAGGAETYAMRNVLYTIK